MDKILHLRRPLRGIEVEELEKLIEVQSKIKVNPLEMDHRLWSTWKENKLGQHPYRMPHEKNSVFVFRKVGGSLVCPFHDICVLCAGNLVQINTLDRLQKNVQSAKDEPQHSFVSTGLSCVCKMQNRWLILLAVWMVANIWNKILKAAKIVWMTLDKFNHFLIQRTVSSPSEQAQSIWMELFSVV